MFPGLKLHINVVARKTFTEQKIKEKILKEINFSNFLGLIPQLGRVFHDSDY